MTPAAFGEKLELTLKAFSMSRGRLASELGVSKSLVSRWVSGVNAPAGHNLTALTELIAGRVPGFSLLDWDADLANLAERLGVSIHPRDAESETGYDALTGLRIRSHVEIEQDGHPYPGVYVAFRQKFANTGRLLAALIVIRRHGAGLAFQIHEDFLVGDAEVLLLRNQLFVVGGLQGRGEIVFYSAYNRVHGRKAIRMDGVFALADAGGLRNPEATIVVLQRLADLASPERPPPQEWIDPIMDRLRAANRQSTVETLAGPVITRAVTPLVGVPRPDGGTDFVLRVTPDRSLICSEMAGWSPAVEADVRRVRLLLLDRDDCFPLLEGDPQTRAAVES